MEFNQMQAKARRVRAQYADLELARYGRAWTREEIMLGFLGDVGDLAYFAVTDQVDALYAQAEPLPADAIGPKMARLRREHHRLLGNGHCTRLHELDCAFEAICETCSFFQTSIEFRPTLQAQHDDDAGKGQDHRAELFNQLLTGLTEGEAS